MKIGLQAWGSTGDIRPMIALGGELVRRGHQVTLAVASVDNRDFGDLCRNLGIACFKAPERYDVDLASLMPESLRSRNPMHWLRVLFQGMHYPGLDVMYQAAEELCAESDVVVGQMLTWPLKIAAGKRGVPHASVTFWPGMIFNPAHPPRRAPNLGRHLNRLSWAIVQYVVDRGIGDEFKVFWRKHGIELKHTLPDSCYSPRLNLVAASPLLWPGYGDWKQHRLCGTFRVPLASEADPLSPDLEAFLEAGEPPVFYSFGSMGECAPQWCDETLLDAARFSGQRAVIQLVHAREVPIGECDRLFFVGRFPHATLLPRCAAVVHHGGAGTTHTVLAAGKPTVVVGFMEEQFAWGERIDKLGLGISGRRLNFPRVSADRIARAVRKVVDSKEVADRAEKLGQALRREDGTGKAAEYIERLARGEL